MTASRIRISATGLLGETFTTMGVIYAGVLTINSPSLIFFVLTTFDLGEAGVPLNIIYWFVAVPFLSGATTFYTYLSLTENPVTVRDAFTQAKRRLLPLIGLYFLLAVLIVILTGFMLFLRPFGLAGLIVLLLITLRGGIYVSCRLLFSFYATVIDNSSVLESLNSSCELTEGRWWLLCRSSFLVVIVFFVPAILISGLIGSTLGNLLLLAQLVGNILGFLAGLLISIYQVLLYRRLRKSQELSNRHLLIES
jgi:hypothetical protein